MTRYELQVMALIFTLTNPRIDILLFGAEPHARPLLSEGRLIAAEALLRCLPLELRQQFMAVRHLCDMGVL